MKSLNRLIKRIKKLRHPVSGCPWDRNQTPDSIREYILEEAYELESAIEQGSPAAQREEAGDLLLQILLLTRMHQERGQFDFREVVDTLSEKIIRRHPHVFGSGRCTDEVQVKNQWERIKKQEKKKKSIISDYPRKMPALLVAKRIGEQASSVGFDWGRADQALEKVCEEVKEVREALSGAAEKSVLAEEIGDLLFAVVNVARLLGINPESALRAANGKFKERFAHIEASIGKNKDRRFSLDELEALWKRAKDLTRVQSDDE